MTKKIEKDLRDCLTEIGIFVPKRNTAKRKKAFLALIFDAFNYVKVKYEKDTQGSVLKTNHIVIGDIQTAKRIIITPYDTPSLMLIPRYEYTPMNAKKCMLYERINAIIYVALEIIVLIGLTIFNSNIIEFSTIKKVIVILIDLLVVYAISKVSIGLSKKSNMNNNSAAVALLYKMILENKIKDTAIVFADNAVAYSKGYEQLAAKYNDLDAEIIILTCIGEGEKLYFVTNGESNLQNEIEKEDSFVLKKVSDDEIRDSIVGMFSKPTIVFSANEINGKLVVKNARNNNDYKVDLERIKKLESILTIK